MVNFDRDQGALIEKKIREQVTEEIPGEVIRVYEHTEPDDPSNFECDVVMAGGSKEERVAPLLMPSTDNIAVPEVGDTVLVGYLGGASRRPFITHGIHTAKDRSPLGKAGMRKEVIPSDSSPAGDGDIYFTRYSKKDVDTSVDSVENATPEETVVRLSKGSDSADPTTDSSRNVSVEFYDAPANDEAHITVELNKRDSNDSDATWGLKFDLKTGEVKLVDPSGYGIVSDGDGNFTWEYESKTENQTSGGGSLSL